MVDGSRVYYRYHHHPQNIKQEDAKSQLLPAFSFQSCIFTSGYMSILFIALLGLIP